MDLKSQQYFGLDEVGTRIWQLLSASGRSEAVGAAAGHLLIIALIIEVLQIFVASQVPAVADVLVNFAAGLIGTAVVCRRPRQAPAES